MLLRIKKKLLCALENRKNLSKIKKEKGARRSKDGIYTSDGCVIVV